MRWLLALTWVLSISPGQTPGTAVDASAVKIGRKPTGATWLEVYGVSVLCGVGFTISLFIGVLAFPGLNDSPEQTQVKLGVLGGSLLSGLAGSIALSLASRRRRAAGGEADVSLRRAEPSIQTPPA